MVIHPMFVRTLIALASLTLASHALAQVYTWKDANGRVQFSDQPPPNADIKPTKPPAGPKYAPAVAAPNTKTNAPSAQSAGVAQSDPKAAPATQSGPKNWQAKDLEYKQRRAAELEAENKRKQEEAKAEEKKRYCEGLRNNVAMFERGGRVTNTNAQGERSFMDDSQMKQEAERARGQLTRDCK